MSAFCFQQWCYVDRNVCKRDPTEALYASQYFAGEELYYFYSTCGAHGDSWLHCQDHDNMTSHVMGGASLLAAVPALQQIFKTDPGSREGVVDSQGDAYYNSSITYEGIYMDYVRDLIRLSGGDIEEVAYTHESRGSSTRYRASRYTALVQDMENRIADMAVAGFWVTTQVSFVFAGCPTSSRLVTWFIFIQGPQYRLCFDFSHRERLNKTAFTIPVCWIMINLGPETGPSGR